MLAMLDGNGRSGCEPGAFSSNLKASTNLREWCSGNMPVSKTVRRGFKSFLSCQMSRPSRGGFLFWLHRRGARFALEPSPCDPYTAALASLGLSR